MFIFIFFLCCFLQPIFHYYSVYGKRESLQRFVVEDGAKPAIFGSYSYDPVKQVFVPPPSDNDTHPGDSATVSVIPDQIVNGSFVYSTAVGDVTSESTHTTHHVDHGPTHHDEHATTHHEEHVTTHHESPNNTTPVFRKHVTSQPPKNSGWWLRHKFPLKNVNSNSHKLNNLLL